MSIGALVSILGVFDVFTLSVARLSYAMANDGIFPPAFARVHPRCETPYVGILFQAITGLVGSILFDLTNLIAISVFFLGICYLLTALSAIRLVGLTPDAALHVPGLRGILVLAALGGLYLSTQVRTDLMLIGIGVMLAGVAIYALRQKAWRDAAEFPATFLREEHRFKQWASRRERWLLRFVRRTR
jgi:amino acid transporter